MAFLITPRRPPILLSVHLLRGVYVRLARDSRASCTGACVIACCTLTIAEVDLTVRARAHVCQQRRRSSGRSNAREG